MMEMKPSEILDAFFKHSITPLVILDRDFNFIRVNEAYAKSCQRDVSEFPGHNHFEFYPSDAQKIFENVVKTKEPYQALARPFIYPDHPEWGVTYWDWTLTPILDNQNEVEFLVFSLKDVTEQKRAEDSLFLFRDLINNSNDAIFVVDPKTCKILNFNDKACSSLGYNRNELINMRIIDIEAIFPDNFSWDNHVKEVKSKGYMLIEGVNKRKDSTTFPVETSVRYISHNEMNYIIGVVRDITERRKLEKEREQFYRFFQTSSDLMCIADPNGHFIKTNPACSELLGFSETELTSKPFVEFVHPDDRQSTLDEMARQLRTGFTLNFENRYICKDGSFRWLSWRAIYNKDEGITYATARDITDYKNAEKKLKQALSYNRILIETSLDPLVTIDSRGKITDVNSATEKVTGYLRNELIGSDFSDYFTEPDKARDGYQKVFRYGSVQDYELAIRHRDGHITSVFYNAAVYRNEAGEISGVFAAARDISARLQVEQELQRLNEELEERVRHRTTALEKLANNIRENQKALLNIVDDLNLSKKELEKANAKLKELDRMKSMFIASMSHELRTPLNSIIGFSSILGNEWIGSVNSEQKEKLATILRAGKHLLNLINDVIDVSKIEAGKIGSSANDFDLYELISEALELFKSDIDKKGLNLEINSMHRTMHTDRRRLLQCIINLISNAVKFTEKGSISIKTQFSHTNGAPSDSVEIIIADTGIGIKEEDIPKLFFPFVRIHTPLSSTIPGTGLGLYLSKKIAVEILKGDIAVKSRYNDGSVFTLKAPVTL
ncbi:MAG: PAS domain S-box protein [Candidatus Schekmanbacteria bacterium]|nr:PAS domain S-box protein [Candidatus Schekmanbacteria bacterium]